MEEAEGTWSKMHDAGYKKNEDEKLGKREIQRIKLRGKETSYGAERETVVADLRDLNN